jgi:nitrogen regulatory protein P-II 1
VFFVGKTFRGLMGGSGARTRLTRPPRHTSEEQKMKLIVAIIRPEKFEEVQDALDAEQVHLMTASDVRGCGTQRGYAENYRGNKGVIRLISKVKLEIAVNDNYVEKAVSAILKAAKTGKIGDGKIFVLPLEAAYRIRTGETGSTAIGP